LAGTLQDKVALVTGASRGIGRAIAQKLASLGAAVAVNYVARAESAAETVATVVQAGGEAMAVQADVRSGDSVQAMVKEIEAKLGPVDILVNNAGITRDGMFARMSEEDWQIVIETNLNGAFHCSKAVLRKMMRRRWGDGMLRAWAGITSGAGSAMIVGRMSAFGETSSGSCRSPT